MYIERTGSGEHTFLGLHGWSGDHRTFSPITTALPANVSFFSADLPGCGKSVPPVQWTLRAVADAIAEAAWKLPTPITLVGNCSGALLGIEAALRLGDRLERLVLIDIFAVFPWYFRVFLSKPIGRYAYAATFRNPAGRWFTNLSLREKRAKETTLTGGFAQVDHDATYRYLQLFETYPQPEYFKGLTQVVDVLYGQKTFRAVRDSAARWQAVWPQAKVTCLNGAGHLPIQEATAQLRGILFHESQGGACRSSSAIITS